MAAISSLNSKADIIRRSDALQVNCGAAKALMEIVRTNLGPRGSLKLLVGGGGTLKMTKDGNVLLQEMHIQHPTASLIARTAAAQDTVTGDGSTTMVLYVGEFLRLVEQLVSEGIHPRLVCSGFDVARTESLSFLDKFRKQVDMNLEALTCVARSNLRTKLIPSLADQLASIVVEAVQTVRQDDKPIDLHMVEVMHMKHRLEKDTRLVKGIVMDHGARHPDMPRMLSDSYVLTCNISMEYEKTEVNAVGAYHTAGQRIRLAEAERRHTDKVVQQIIEFKRSVCDDKIKNFAIFNQKGIDPMSLDMLAKEGIFALRRVKQRNMERIPLCCGGVAVNSVENLSVSDLGIAKSIVEQSLGEDKYTFLEVANPRSCTILLKGPADHTIAQLQDATRDGLRAVKNALGDGYLVPGGGAFEIALHSHLVEFAKTISGKRRLGIQAFARALLVVPRTLAINSGFDPEEAIADLQAAYEKTQAPCAQDLFTGEIIDPTSVGLWDTYRVKRQSISLSPSLAQQLMLVDEIIKAGKNMGGDKI